jgi:hypothetical protein
MNYVQGSLRSLLKKVSDPAKLPVLMRSANRESISYGDSYGAGGGAERFFNSMRQRNYRLDRAVVGAICSRPPKLRA